MPHLIRLSEPLLLFNYGQAMEDPRDGLTLFGPFDRGSLYGLRTGVIGTAPGIQKFRTWTARIQTPIRTKKPIQSRPPFPGFEALFRIPWGQEPLLVLTIDEEELKKRLYQDDRFQRVFQTVDLFADAIIKAHSEEERKPDMWFVVIPDDVRKYCRPHSVMEPEVRVEAKRYFADNLRENVKRAQSLLSQPSLFKEDNVEAEPYAYKEHFRNQLKAKLLPHMISTQVVRESTVANLGPLGVNRDVNNLTNCCNRRSRGIYRLRLFTNREPDRGRSPGFERESRMWGSFSSATISPATTDPRRAALRCFSIQETGLFSRARWAIGSIRQPRNTT